MSFSIYILTWLQSAIFYLFTSFLFLCPIFNLPFYVFTWLRGVIYPSVSFKLVTLCHFLSFYMSFQHVPAVLPVWAGDDVKRQSEGERERERATNTEVYKSEESWRENAQFVNNCKSDRSDPPRKKCFLRCASSSLPRPASCAWTRSTPPLLWAKPKSIQVRNFDFVQYYRDLLSILNRLYDRKLRV